MKITKQTLQKLINEELQNALHEADDGYDWLEDPRRHGNRRGAGDLSKSYHKEAVRDLTRIKEWLSQKMPEGFGWSTEITEAFFEQLENILKDRENRDVESLSAYAREQRVGGPY